MYFNVTRPKICLGGSFFKSFFEISRFRKVFIIQTVSEVSLISLSVSVLQRAAVLLSTSQIIPASLCYCWWSINQLLFHSSGRLCSNTHLLRVHFTWWFFQWMAELQLQFLYPFIKKKKTLMELSARLQPLPLKLSPALAAPQHLIHIHFFNPSLFILRFSPHSCLLLPSARFHLPCLRRQLRALHVCPDKLKHFTFKPGENCSAETATLLLPIIFFRGLMLVSARHRRHL